MRALGIGAPERMCGEAGPGQAGPCGQPTCARPGRNFDKNGNMLDWWSNFSAQHFQKQSECMIHQYGNYSWDLADNQNVSQPSALPPPPGTRTPAPAPGGGRAARAAPPSRVLCAGERLQHTRGKHRRQRRGAAGIQGGSEQGPLKDGRLVEAETVPRPSRGAPWIPPPWVLEGSRAPGGQVGRGRVGTSPHFTPTLAEPSTSGEATAHLQVRQ